MTAPVVSDIGDSAWTDQVLELRARFVSGRIGTNFTRLYVRYLDAENHYYLSIDLETAYFARVLDGVSTTLGAGFEFPFVNGSGMLRPIKIEAIGGTLNAYADGVLYGSATDTAIPAGRIALGVSGRKVFFDDVRVTRP